MRAWMQLQGGVVHCPLQGRCQTPSLVYQADVTSNECKTYIGQAASTFNHKNSYINLKKKLETTLSTYVWKL